MNYFNITFVSTLTDQSV